MQNAERGPLAALNEAQARAVSGGGLGDWVEGTVSLIKEGYEKYVAEPARELITRNLGPG
ncbi:MAG TPA: hypothetical protein VFH27_07750 [Longimicrobiaceae bacterium]|nr:hypothetical protein [Longimicrobiaceae bacterium]